MLVTPIVEVVGKEIGTNPEPSHAAEVRVVRHLAMLQRKPRVRCRCAPQHLFNRVDRHGNRLIAVGVNVHLKPGVVIAGENARQLIGIDVPQPVVGAVVVARPLQSCREALDRAVEHQLDQPVAQLRVAARNQLAHPADAVGGRSRHADEGRHHAQGEQHKKTDNYQNKQPTNCCHTVLVFN